MGLTPPVSDAGGLRLKNLHLSKIPRGSCRPRTTLLHAVLNPKRRNTRGVGLGPRRALAARFPRSLRYSWPSAGEVASSAISGIWSQAGRCGRRQLLLTCSRHPQVQAWRTPQINRGICQRGPPPNTPSFQKDAPALPPESSAPSPRPARARARCPPLPAPGAGTCAHPSDASSPHLSHLAGAGDAEGASLDGDEARSRTKAPSMCSTRPSQRTADPTEPGRRHRKRARRARAHLALEASGSFPGDPAPVHGPRRGRLGRALRGWFWRLADLKCRRPSLCLLRDGRFTPEGSSITLCICVRQESVRMRTCVGMRSCVRMRTCVRVRTCMRVRVNPISLFGSKFCVVSCSSALSLFAGILADGRKGHY